MWMVDPKLMCRQHLLGEHNEIHKIIGSLNKGKSITGYIENNCIELMSIHSRHEVLVNDMLRRGYNHKSPISLFDVSHIPYNELFYRIDREKAEQLLKHRCNECFKNQKL